MRSSPYIDPKEQQILLETARASIKSCFSNDPPPDVRIPGDSKANQALGAFVTIKREGASPGMHRKHRRKASLCGRASRSWPGPVLSKTAVSPPLSVDELAGITIEISVLSALEAIDDYRSIRIGTHGILISHGSHRGLFLPQVAVEQGWDLDSYLSHCLSEGRSSG